jgi:hypothetical protein
VGIKGDGDQLVNRQQVFDLLEVGVFPVERQIIITHE